MLNSRVGFIVAVAAILIFAYFVTRPAAIHWLMAIPAPTLTEK
jgi:hypothetical protein